MTDHLRSLGEGFCRKQFNDWYYFGSTSSFTASECYDKCKNKAGCAAFSFKGPTKWCETYRGGPGGPYTKGSGNLGYTCYTLGILTLFDVVLK